MPLQVKNEAMQIFQGEELGQPSKRLRTWLSFPSIHALASAWRFKGTVLCMASTHWLHAVIFLVRL